MWTPRRFLIYFVALIGCMTAFVAVWILVPIDNLAPLPPHYFAGPPGKPIQPNDRTTETNLQIIRAFGIGCEEFNRRSKIWLPAKGVVLTINNFEIEPDGRVKLSPFSVGLFPKNLGEQRYPEIHTIQCEYAILTLDRPVTSLMELNGKGKVVGVELGGDKGVKITNNRKSQEKNDDLELYVTEGKLFYEDSRNLIWTNGFVKLLDTQSKPLPTQVTAVGMEVALNKDVSPNRKKSDIPKKDPTKKNDGVSGVENITLLSNVDMHLYTDARSGFLTGPDELAKKPAKANEPEAKAHVHIKTNGRFVFDLAKDTARFDAPLRPALAHDRVTVTRYVAAKPPKSGIVTDLLDCDRLDLQFRKKSGDSPGSNDKDIEFAIATAKPQAIVELHLEGEEMHATGVEMHYFAPTAKVGPRTIIKGAPMHAMRQGNQIHCDELHLKGADKQGNGQEAYAKGPGKIDLLDKKTGRSTTHVLFKTSFTATKDREGERLFELLTLRGDASFIDEENKHEIHAAQFLHVWLEDLKPDPKADPKADPKKTEGGQKSRPHKLEAFEKVQVRSPELNIRDANHLNVVFVEQKIIPVAKSFEGVAVLPAIAASGPAKTTETGFIKDAPEPATPNIAVPNPTVAVAKEKPKRPLEVTGTKISVQIATMGNVKELLEFLADGNVHITQEAENPKDKGLEIIGSTVSLTRKLGGDTLQVFGEPRKLAQLQQNEMLLFGPKVTIDQVKNLAEVEGTGAMHMPSNTTLDGKKKNGHITIHWNKSMVFDGKFAEFVGGVEAFQDNGKILCQEMQVTMDKPVVFKKTNGNQTAKIDRIICNGREDRKVLILEEDRDAKNALQMYRRLLLAVVEVDNIEQKMNGSGPGVLDFISRSSASDPGLAGGEKPKGAEPAKKDDEKILKWTRVRFEGQMLSYPTATGGRQTTFLEQVRVYHQPGDDPNVRDPSEVGPGGLFFTCQRLTIIQRKVGNKNSQEMIADGMNGMVNFQAKEFHGNAKMVKYDESQEQIIFEGVPGAPATLFKMPKIIGDRPQRIQGSKILYNRKTGEFLLDGVTVISSWLFIEDKPAVDLACGEPRIGIARFERCDS